MSYSTNKAIRVLCHKKSPGAIFNNAGNGAKNSGQDAGYKKAI
ncbi:hypothetical protein BN1221_01934c [Brenneria goodwinii]|uniref:Uncharacterized protein n=1 Tax=Brenneria goodwinii TaxID=1109412 RepID=A0A0G4JU89_9GAMM|nr:hypothetical protein BN1221_01934c [Brenneria goodwinii]